MPKILIIDDEKSIRTTLKTWLTLGGHEVEAVATLKEGHDCLKQVNFDAIILDVFLQGEDGLEFLSQDLPPGVPVIVISGQGDLSTAVRAMKMGATDFLEKPLEGDHLTLVLNRVFERTRLKNEMEGFKEDWFRQNFVQGKSKVMADAVTLVKKAAGSPLIVLITGPSGSGKEGLAEAVHRFSPRARGPFVTVNCASISDGLFESELFGHVKGSFTGATGDKKGFFQKAQGGTLFLDEVGEIPLELQSKLLRAVERGEIPVVGREESIKVDVRLVAATNRPLEREVQEKRFREDLFFRLNQVRIEVPTLDQRREDLPELVEFFRQDFAKKNNIFRTFTQESLAWFSEKSWPGNVRELRAFVERVLVLSDNEIIRPQDLSLFQAVGAHKSNPIFERTLPWKAAKKELEKTYLEVQLALHAGKIADLAQSLDILPNNLSRKLKDLGLEK